MNEDEKGAEYPDSLHSIRQGIDKASEKKRAERYEGEDGRLDDAIRYDRTALMASFMARQ
ncbi:MAG TPA: hypothetical protein P5298_15170 [Spirochaetia bacterium]|nr:hypothetical protein [Spirochaetia bacterium]